MPAKQREQMNAVKLKITVVNTIVKVISQDTDRIFKHARLPTCTAALSLQHEGWKVSGMVEKEGVVQKMTCISSGLTYA